LTPLYEDIPEKDKWKLSSYELLNIIKGSPLLPEKRDECDLFIKLIEAYGHAEYCRGYDENEELPPLGADDL